ncbi:MAG: hypothetical protein E7234_00650 [Lachnospiraceae bacterium]|nr:hypothetical protein [Lachnospiraceae bacterium]
MPAFFNTVRNGYNPEEVDKHIQNLESIIESYREKDGAISNAIVNAQIAADNIIKNSELAAKEMRKNAVDQLDVIADSIEKQRQIILEFKSEYNLFVEKYVKKINDEEFDQMLKRVEDLDKYFQKLKNDKPVPSAKTEGPKNPA